MTAGVQTADGVYTVDVEEERVLELDPDAELAREPLVATGLPRVLATSASGSTIVALVDRKPPLVVSHDAGRTWRESGHGLPPGRAVAIAPDDPDLILFAARNRLYVSGDGGRFWQALAVELPEIDAVAWLP